MKRVVVISGTNHYEERAKSVIEEYQKEHEVIYLTSDFNHWKKEYFSVELPFAQQLHVPGYQKNISVSRIWSHIVFSIKTFFRLCKLKPDIVYAEIPHNTLAVATKWYKRLHKCELIFDIFDMWPEALPMKSNNPVFKLACSVWGGFRNHNLKFADKVYTECNYFQELINQEGCYVPMETKYLTRKKIDLDIQTIWDADRLHICYGYGLFTGGLGLDFGARALGCMSIPMSSGNTQRQLMCMEDFGATAFACTPSYAMYLAEAAKEAGVVERLQLKAGINGAEPWTDEMRHQIEDTLNVNCFDIYGLCEITGPGVACDCIHHKGLHVYEDHFFPEVLNPVDHTPCAEGETGELVFTTLSKEGMPLIRYRTKDLTSIEYGKCECGRTLPRIQKFTGRTDDMKVIRGVNVFPTQVEAALLSIGEGVAPHYMMVVDRENNLDVLTVMVEVDEKYFSDEIRKLEALKKKIELALKQALGVAVKVKLCEPKSIQRSEGKAKRVIDNRNL